MLREVLLWPSGKRDNHQLTKQFQFWFKKKRKWKSKGDAHFPFFFNIWKMIRNVIMLSMYDEYKKEREGEIGHWHLFTVFNNCRQASFCWATIWLKGYATLIVPFCGQSQQEKGRWHKGNPRSLHLAYPNTATVAHRSYFMWLSCMTCFDCQQDLYPHQHVYLLFIYWHQRTQKGVVPMCVEGVLVVPSSAFISILSSPDYDVWLSVLSSTVFVYVCVFLIRFPFLFSFASFLISSHDIFHFSLRLTIIFVQKMPSIFCPHSVRVMDIEFLNIINQIIRSTFSAIWQHIINFYCCSISLWIFIVF